MVFIYYNMEYLNSLKVIGVSNDYRVVLFFLMEIINRWFIFSEIYCKYFNIFFLSK